MIALTDLDLLVERCVMLIGTFLVFQVMSSMHTSVSLREYDRFDRSRFIY